MLISSCNLYPFVDESHFVEREYYEVYPEIYGDPIYDNYEDDVYVIDFVFKENSFENLRHENFVWKRIIEDLVQNHDNLVRPKIGLKILCRIMLIIWYVQK